MRGRAYIRHQRRRSIQRKVQIARHAWGDWFLEKKRFVGKFAKGKVHCSCGMCSGKTRDRGNRISEKRRFNDMDQQLKDL